MAFYDYIKSRGKLRPRPVNTSAPKWTDPGRPATTRRTCFLFSNVPSERLLRVVFLRIETQLKPKVKQKQQKITVMPLESTCCWPDAS